MPGTELARYIPPFLKKIFSQENFIHKLPLDIWIDWIIPYLTIEDVICLRRVNKTLFLITHEPIIWKRFLVRMPIPIPPLRPSLRWSWDLTSFQIEQIVAKAVAADDNWRRLSPKFGHARVIYAFYEVLEMKILPGGQYMVASVTHKSSRRFYICLFSLDHSDNMAPPLARLPVPAKVYGLEARFLRWKGGRPGIMIMYSQRSPRDGQSYGYDLNEWGARTDMDPPFAIRHDCFCAFMDMEALELLADPTVVNDSEVFRERAKALPTPFQFVIHFVSNAHTEHHSLFEVDGKPFAAVVQKPNEVVIMDLTSSQLSSIKCLRIPEFNAVEHKIRAIRVLPKQNQVLVVRTLRLRKLNEKLDQHTVELYTLPDAGVLGLQSEPDQYFLIENRNAMSIHLSDHYEPLRGRDHPLLHDPYGRPPPITIYVCGEQLEGMEVINVEPDLNPDGQWVYDLTWWCTQSTITDKESAFQVIPGAHRALVYTVPVDYRGDAPKIKSLGRYCSQGYFLTSHPHPPPKDEVSSVLRLRYQPPADEYYPIRISSSMFQHIAEVGASAITWDESTGRVCIAMQKNMKFLILDVRRDLPPDDRFAHWRRVQEMMNKEPRL